MALRLAGREEIAGGGLADVALGGEGGEGIAGAPVADAVGGAEGGQRQQVGGGQGALDTLDGGNGGQGGRCGGGIDHAQGECVAVVLEGKRRRACRFSAKETHPLAEHDAHSRVIH